MTVTEVIISEIGKWIEHVEESEWLDAGLQALTGLADRLCDEGLIHVDDREDIWNAIPEE